MHCYLDKREGSPNWYIYQYDPATGQCDRFSTRTADLAAAKKKLEEHIINLPNRQQPDAPTLIWVVLRYWQHHGKDVDSPNAIRRVMALLAEHEPTTLLSEWRRAEQQKFLDKIGGKPGTRRRYMGAIQTAVQWAFDREEIPRMPAIMRVHADDEEGVRPFEVDELKRLLETAGEHEHWRRFILLSITTIPRPIAVLRLTWDRIDGKLGVVNYKVPGRRVTKKRYAVAPLPPLALAYLEAHRSVGPVVQWKDRALETHKMTFGRIAQRAKVDGSAYGIRKGVATWLRQQGIPESHIKGMLGHSLGGETDRYAHHRPEFMHAARHATERLLREICPPWLASYLPVVPAVERTQVQVVVSADGDGGSCRARTCDQFLKRNSISEDFQVPTAANDD